MGARRSARPRGSRTASAPPPPRWGDGRTGQRRWRAATTAAEEQFVRSCARVDLGDADRQANTLSRTFSFIVVGLEAAALKAWINSGGSVRPHPDVCCDQRVDLEAGELPTLFSQRREHSLRRASELAPQLL